MFFAALVGLVMGFFGSIPVAGPIAALVLDRGLAGRVREGLGIAVGSTFGECGYAFLAFWGFGHLIAAFPWLEPMSSAIGAVILLVLSVVFIRSKDAWSDADAPESSESSKRAFLLGASVTALNPALLATWAAAMTLVQGAGVEMTLINGVFFSIGAAIGIVVWFWIMLLLLSRFRARFRPSALRKMRFGVAAFLALVGLWFAVKTALYYCG